MTTPPPSRLDSPDPAARERAARESIEHHRTRMAEMAAIREQAVRDLYLELGSWDDVGETIGTSAQNAHKLATRKARKGAGYPER
jgi:hypothetical protein